SCTMLRWIVLLTVLACGVASAETPWPLRTPAELKALRGADSAGMQILTYRRSQGPKEAETDVTIGIGRTAIFREQGRTRRVIDLVLGRIYDLRDDKRFVSYPIVADIVFRDTEMGNRVVLAKALAAAGIEQSKIDPVGDPFWNATELHVTVPNEPAPAVET